MDTRKQQKSNTKRRSIFVTSFSFFLISFVGWLYETALMYISTGEYCDRGFLRLPFCPIYGGVVCLLYLLCGTPKEGVFAGWVEKLCLRKGWHLGIARMLRYVGYFVLAMALATGMELVVGLLFQRAGCCLWSYSGMACNYKGVISLPVSLFWGFLITVAMRYPFSWLLVWVGKIPKPILVGASIALAVATIVDFVVCLVQL